MGLKLCSLIYKSIFAQKYCQIFIINWLDAWQDEKKMTFKNLIIGNFWGPEVVGSSSCQKNIGVKFTHLYRPSLC
jgi:hypothetical protein